METLERALASVDDSVKQIRQIVHRLRDPDPSVVLVERLRREASLARNNLGFAPSLLVTLDGVAVSDDNEGGYEQALEVIDNRVGADRADDVVAVVREALSNTARHARASSARVEVKVCGQPPAGSVCVSVSDDGAGLDPRCNRRSGLDNLAARARRHGGDFQMVSEPGNGLSLTWRVPLS